MTTLRRFLVFLAIAFSFGGFTFYASVVVPIGGLVLGTTTQGFVTRQVTNIMNIATAVTVAILAWELAASWTQRSRRRNLAFLSLLATISATCIVLAVLHARLDGMLVPTEMSVSDHDVFYGWHRIYLWVSALQWAATIPVIWMLLGDWTKNFATHA